MTAPAVSGADVAVFRLPDGDEFEIFGPDSGALPFEGVPVVAFLVADVGEARAEMEAKGVIFLGPTEGSEGSAWAYLRAPDGHVYELTSRPPRAPGAASSIGVDPQPECRSDEPQHRAVSQVSQSVIRH